MLGAINNIIIAELQFFLVFVLNILLINNISTAQYEMKIRK